MGLLRNPVSFREKKDMPGACRTACFTREKETVQKMHVLLLLLFIARWWGMLSATERELDGARSLVSDNKGHGSLFLFAVVAAWLGSSNEPFRGLEAGGIGFARPAGTSKQIQAL